jgi:hypothetical protein
VKAYARAAESLIDALTAVPAKRPAAARRRRSG